MGDSLGKLIIKSYNNERETGVYFVTDSSSIVEYRYNKSNSERGLFKITLIYNEIIRYELNNYSFKNRVDSVDYYEFFGWGDNYKYLFDELCEATETSRNEIANIIQNETVCKNIDKKDNKIVLYIPNHIIKSN